MSQYFPPYRSFRGDIKVELDLSNYATDAGILKTIRVDLAKLSNVVKKDAVKKTEYNSLKTKVDSIDTTNFVLKTKYEKDGSDFEDKISKINKKNS